MTAKSNIKRCRFGRCLHETKDIDIEKEDYVKGDGASSFYHRDCKAVKDDIETVKMLWHDHISENVVFSQLTNIINRIIFDKHIPSEYLVFAMQYVIKYKKPLKHPPGLYYIIDDSAIKAAWAKHKAKQIVGNAKFEAKTDEKTEPVFSVKRKTQGFGDIFGGK